LNQKLKSLSSKSLTKKLMSMKHYDNKTQNTSLKWCNWSNSLRNKLQNVIDLEWKNKRRKEHGIKTQRLRNIGSKLNFRKA